MIILLYIYRLDKKLFILIVLGDATANGNLKDKNLVSSPALNARQNHSQNRPVAGANWNMGKQPQGKLY